MSSQEEIEERLEALEELFEELAGRVDGIAPLKASLPQRASEADFDASVRDVAGWFKERCVRDAGTRMPWADLYDDFADWCRLQGHEPRLSPTSRNLTYIIRSYGFRPYRTATARGYVGLRFIDDE